MQNFTRIILIVILWNITVTLQQDDGRRVSHVSMQETWHTARKVCKVTDRLLLPELSDRPLFLDQLKETLQPGDFVWINAKQLTIDFTYSRKYLRLAYAYQNLTLQNCMCFNGRSYSLCVTGVARFSWPEAARTCGSNGTWQSIKPSNAQIIVGLLKDEMPVWLQKYGNNILPETEIELCMGLERQTDGSFADRMDNCSSKHSFFCVKDPDKYSPTLTRLSEPVSVVTGHGDHDNMSESEDEHEKGPGENSPNLTRLLEQVSLATGHGDHDIMSVSVDEHEKGPGEYSPTLTRLFEQVSLATGHGDHSIMSVPVDEHPKDRKSNADNEDTARPGLVFGVVGGMAALLVVLLVGFGARYVLSRYRLIQQYRKSLRRTC